MDAALVLQHLQHIAAAGQVGGQADALPAFVGQRLPVQLSARCADEQVRYFSLWCVFKGNGQLAFVGVGVYAHGFFLLFLFGYVVGHFLEGYPVGRAVLVVVRQGVEEVNGTANISHQLYLTIYIQ